MTENPNKTPRYISKEERRDEKRRWKHCSKCTAYCFGAKNKRITRGNKIIKVVFLHLITYVTRYENWDFRITIQKYEATKLQEKSDRIKALIDLSFRFTTTI